MTDQVARATLASSWLEQLQSAPSTSEPFLVRASSGEVLVVEDGRRREIPSGLLTAALAVALGAPRDMTDEELQRLDDGVPVEVLEAPRGKPFVIVGGRRMPIRGLPLPHPVGDDVMQQFGDGAELNLSAANVARAEFQEALSGKYQLKAARDVIGRKGVVPAVSGWGRRAWQRLSGRSAA